MSKANSGAIGEAQAGALSSCLSRSEGAFALHFLTALTLPVAAAAPPPVVQAVADRPAADRLADKIRPPAETLTFANVKPDTLAIARLHRIERTQVIREVTAAGFRLAAEGEFLRRAGEDHSLSISDRRIQGHTDQYALRVVKPRR